MTGSAALPLFIGSGILYLHTQMIAYYTLALLLGLLLGYLIWGWGRRGAEERARAEGVRSAERKADAEGQAGEVGRLRSELDIATKARVSLEARLQKMKVEAVPAPLPPEPVQRQETAAGGDAAPDSDATEQKPDPEPVPVEVEASLAASEDGPGTGRTPHEPERLDAPRGNPDNLKKIKGVGPKIEKTLNELGVYHFDQIAGWNEPEITWVDARLKFKGRILREKWVDQARNLAGDPQTPA